MKRLLRSLIDADGQISQENLILNYQKIARTTGFSWGQPADTRIFEFLGWYFQLHLNLPALQSVTDHFDSKNDVEVTERLKEVAQAPFYVLTNFSQLLRTIQEDQKKVKANLLLREAHDILNKGKKPEGEEEKLEGVRDSVNYFIRHAAELTAPDHGTRIRGDLRRDGAEVRRQYQEAKVNKANSWGRMSGLTEIDNVCHGIRKGEMWLHAGFAGELKTTLATNWCYNLVTRYRCNVFYTSLEMTYEHLRRLIYTMHSANLRWHLKGYQPLDYGKVRDGLLSPEEEAFYNLVIDDFEHNPEYCSFDVWAPDHDVTIDDIRLEAELLHKQKEIGMAVIDHGGLVEARKKKRNKDYVIELNSVLRDSKKMALQFNHGEGLPLLLLFQINRNGKDEADKNEGRYRMSCLSYANEAERSADVITTTYLNTELRRQKVTLLCNLKNRDNPLFEPFHAGVDFTCRRIKNLNNYSGAKGMVVVDGANPVAGMFDV